MPTKIILEEHFALPETLGDSAQYAADGTWPQLERRLIDIDGERLAEMDDNSVTMSVLSLNAPAVQAVPDSAHAIALARKANDYLAERIARHPTRFAGLAALPMQNPDAAASELRRCVKDLGFVGALVNGFSELGDSVLYYDDPRYLPFWAEVQALEVAFYLHPRDPLPNRTRDYEGHPWNSQGPAWAFGVETAMHALRLMGSGLLTVIHACRSSSVTLVKACPTACGGSINASSGRPAEFPRGRRWRPISLRISF